MRKFKSFVIGASMLLASSLTVMPVLATTTETEYIQELFGKGATLQDIQKKKTESYEEIHEGDFFTGDGTGVVLADGKAKVLENGEIKEVILATYLLDHKVTFYHTQDGLYEEPVIHRTSQKKETEAVIAKFNTGTITKVDKETKEPVNDATFGLFISTEGGRWLRVATLSPTDTVSTQEIKQDFATKEYNVKEWISNYDNISPDNKAKYKNMAKSEPADKADKKSEEQLTKELDDLIRKGKETASKWMIIEDEVKNGYLRSSQNWQGEVKDDKITIPEINLVEENILGTVADSVESKLKASININLTGVDKITNEPVNGGTYDVYVSYVNNPDDSMKVGSATFKNGKLQGTYNIETSRSAMYGSGEVQYVKEYGKLPNYARKLYQGLPKSQKQAKEVANKYAKEKVANALIGYENADRIVRLVEKGAPDGYNGVGTFTVPVQKGSANKDVSFIGAGKLSILVTDMTGNDLAGAHIKVESTKGNHLIKDYITGSAKEEVSGVVTGESYRITQIDPPAGYVRLKESVKTVNSTITAETKETAITELKATYKHQVKGIKVGVYNKKDELIDQWVTNGEAHAILNLNQYEEYVLKELAPVAGYYKNPDVPFKVENKDVNLTAVSNKITVKTPIKLSGCEFTVTDNATNTVVDTWPGGKRDLHGLEKDHEYTIRQTKTPDGYVQALDYVLKTEPRDQELEIALSRVEIKNEDVDGNAIIGSEISVINKNGEVIDSHVMDEIPYNPSHMMAGNDYVIHVSKPAKGYLSGKDWFLELKTDGENYSHTLISEIQRVTHKDDEDESIKGSTFEVIDKDGNVVDNWITGQHIIDIDEASVRILDQKGSLKIKDGKYKRSVPDSVKGEAIDNLTKGVHDSLPILYEPTNAYSPQTYFEMALEKLPMKQEDKDAKIANIIKQVSKIKGSTKTEEAEKVLEALKADLRNLMDSLTVNLDTVKNISITKQEENADYLLVMTDDTGISSYYDIDINGDETTHRISGMVEGNKYTVKTTQVAGAYTGTMEVSTQADAKADSLIKIKSERKIKPVVDNSIDISTRTVMWVALGIVTLGIAFIFWKLTKRKELPIE